MYQFFTNVMMEMRIRACRMCMCLHTSFSDMFSLVRLFRLPA